MMLIPRIRTSPANDDLRENRSRYFCTASIIPASHTTPMKIRMGHPAEHPLSIRRELHAHDGHSYPILSWSTRPSAWISRTQRGPISLLNEKLRGHDDYYGVTGNIRMLSRLRYEVAKLWRRWLQRRNRSSSPNWERFQGMLSVFPLFPARIIHSKM